MLRAAGKQSRENEKVAGVEPTERLRRASIRVALRPGFLLIGLTVGLVAVLVASPGPAHADSEAIVSLDPAPVGWRLDRSSDPLFAVPSPTYVYFTPSTDEALAAAVRSGNDPGLERPNPFRKRKIDLFRSEHPFAIGENEMLLRLRLRAKMSKAVSVELKF